MRQHDFSASILDAVPALVMVVDARGRIVSFNRACQETSGYSEAEAEAQGSWQFLVDLGERAGVGEVLDEVRSTSGSVAHQSHLLTKSGKRRLIAWGNTTLATPDAEGAYVICTGQDITDHELADEALLASEARYRFIAANTPDVIWTADAVSGRFTFVSDSVRVLRGYEPHEVLEQTMGEALTPESAQIAAGVLLDSIAKRAPGETRVYRDFARLDQVRSDGSIVPTEVSTTLVFDDDGRPGQIIGVSRDITERLHAEETLIALRDAKADLLLEDRIRLALAASLRAIPSHATTEEAAQAVCDALVTIRPIDMALVEAFMGEDDLQVIASAGPLAGGIKAGDRLPLEVARRARNRSVGGPWAQYWKPTSAYGIWGKELQRQGLKAIAIGPIVRGSSLIGSVLIGTFDAEFAKTLVERMPAVMAISGTSSALLADRLAESRARAEMRETLRAALASGAFHPVFQPIVDLETGAVVGHEALTRFDSGRSPDRCFADAWSSDFGPELEYATLTQSVAEARRLPPDCWLSLNVSPRVVVGDGRLSDIIAAADRPIVLEVTEHDLIEDYGAVRDAVRALGPNVSLAVDDAGTGVANFAHIIDLRPAILKLDISLCHGVDTDANRRALVRGMVYLSVSAGCLLLAEGVETEAEAKALLDLGVDLGQGYLFGRPGLARRHRPPTTRHTVGSGSEVRPPQRVMVLPAPRSVSMEGRARGPVRVVHVDKDKALLIAGLDVGRPQPRAPS